MRRRQVFAIGEYYHIFNRGVEKRKIFNYAKDYLRFLDCLVYFNTEKPSWIVNDMRESGIDARPKDDERLVDLIAYCLNSNHFHLLLKQNKEKGITDFMKKLCTGYAMYFNKKYEHSGVLFQGRFQSVHIDSNDQLLYVSAYINGNSQIHGIASAENYPWCSFPEYLGKPGIGCLRDSISGQFKNSNDYKTFCLDKIVGMKERKKNEKYLLEN